ncbi:hypothetical protein BI344_13465 [Chromobacterium sphagni]|uniref:Uncharacterized protein n=3 Tax=Chromobacterium sphagni TaxID=1903179 RepID=A0ABX3CFV5_9NEIS|nr:hypothetical protein BI344_13465 [Chromobacterium sphagni]
MLAGRTYGAMMMDNTPVRNQATPSRNEILPSDEAMETEDELQKLISLVQQRYHLAREKAEERVRAFLDTYTQ